MPQSAYMSAAGMSAEAATAANFLKYSSPCPRFVGRSRQSAPLSRSRENKINAAVREKSSTNMSGSLKPSSSSIPPVNTTGTSSSSNRE